ncbi:hypothetical protein Droror1_Dr00010905 [Drosera rotundifolia]
MDTHSMLHPTTLALGSCCCCCCCFKRPPPPPSLSSVILTEYTGTPQNGGSGDDGGDEDSFVDELLNLNNDDDNTTADEEQDEEQVVAQMGLKIDLNTIPCCFLSPPPSPPAPPTKAENREDSLNDDLGSVLAVPADEADLEWLSQFVEDSFCHHFPSPYLTGPKPFTFVPGPTSQGPDPKTSALAPRSKRSRRARTGVRVRVWSSSLIDSTTASSSSCSSSSPPPPHFSASGLKRPFAGNAGGGAIGRRCSHCGVQKTPQWREGPNGPKTLCNACGVRYKKGRLLPEYRPASSPTFSRELHSNSHRKVLEMRKMKEKEMVMTMAAGRNGNSGSGLEGSIRGFV